MSDVLARNETARSSDRESIMDRMSEDDLTVIFSYLPFKEKVKCELVCLKWRIVAGRLVASQKALGNAPTNLSLVDHCQNKRHWVSRLDCIPKRILTNLALLPKILQKCPDLRAIAITKPREPTFSETVLEKSMAKNSNPFGTEVVDLEAEDEMVVNTAGPSTRPTSVDHMRRIQECFLHSEGNPRLSTMSGILRKMAKTGRETKVEPRPISQEDLLDIIAKYCKNLECIDIYGLRMSRGHRADQSNAGTWHWIIQSCPKLVHLRTFQMYDKEFQAIISSIALTDISVVYGMKGDNLNEVGPTFRKMCIPSMKELGLRMLSVAASLNGLRELSLASVNKFILGIISNFSSLDTLNLSLAAKDLEPDDLSKIAKLTNLKWLYLKRREEPFEKFDRPFNDIISNCTHLRSIRLNNIIISDTSLKNIQFHLFDLQTLKIQLTIGKTNSFLSDRSLVGFGELKQLERIEIDYPNTFTENTLIDFLFRAYNVRRLLIHGCKELIPITQIGLAAIRQAGCANRKNKPLSVDIDTRENMEMSPVKPTMRMKPRNLSYTISTALDHYSTVYPDGRPPIGEQDEDFDEHRAFFFENQ